MQNTVTLTGLVATTPRHLVTQDGLPITSFRIAVTVSNRASNIGTSWFTVTSFHQLAINVSASINKGDQIVVSGLLSAVSYTHLRAHETG
jgi:single-strand DNA-binding protein